MNMKWNLSIFFMLVLIVVLTGCGSIASSESVTGNAVSEQETRERTINIDKLEIFHFHGNNQCHSCITVGDYAEATVETYFEDELEEGVIVFDHINGQLPENRGLVEKYGATGSSLWLGTYDGDDFTAEQDVQVWYKIRDKQAYMDYLKGVIEDKLAGN
ncbi:MAG: nitrophenyl compound nitroreductase subunit ArsF family protein [Candidatus Woesearchaeota archaeon]